MKSKSIDKSQFIDKRKKWGVKFLKPPISETLNPTLQKTNKGFHFNHPKSTKKRV